MFPELKTALDEAWELASEDTIYVVDARYRRAAKRKMG
jgi:predicted nucleic acid-binding protein